MSTFKVNRNDILKAAIGTYGMEAQKDVMLEEMAELSKAILKSRRPCTDDMLEQRLEDIREEIADVQIMLDQMKIIYGDIEAIEDKKLSRLMDRILGIDI